MMYVAIITAGVFGGLLTWALFAMVDYRDMSKRRMPLQPYPHGVKWEVTGVELDPRDVPEHGLDGDDAVAHEPMCAACDEYCFAGAYVCLCDCHVNLTEAQATELGKIKKAIMSTGGA